MQAAVIDANSHMRIPLGPAPQGRRDRRTRRRGRCPRGGVTGRLSAHSIKFVIATTARTLTKRRAVDFCHVATAICPPVPPS